MSNKLNAGDAFPEITLTTTEGATVTLPSAAADGYQIVLFYRGSF